MHNDRKNSKHKRKYKNAKWGREGSNKLRLIGRAAQPTNNDKRLSGLSQSSVHAHRWAAQHCCAVPANSLGYASHNNHVLLMLKKQERKFA
jgi:hypothetical protein